MAKGSSGTRGITGTPASPPPGSASACLGGGPTPPAAGRSGSRTSTYVAPRAAGVASTRAAAAHFARSSTGFPKTISGPRLSETTTPRAPSRRAWTARSASGTGATPSTPTRVRVARSSRRGPASDPSALTGGDEHHVGALERLLDLVPALVGGAVAHLGVGARTEAARELAAELELDVGVAHGERLRVGVDRDELDALEAGVDHAVHRVGAAAAHSDDLYDGQVAARFHGLGPCLGFSVSAGSGFRSTEGANARPLIERCHPSERAL